MLCHDNRRSDRVHICRTNACTTSNGLAGAEQINGESRVNTFLIGIAILWLSASVAFFLIARHSVIVYDGSRWSEWVYEYSILALSSLLFPLLGLYYGVLVCFGHEDDL
jgi:hypothetical protein